MSIGQRIKTMRLQQGLTIDDLAYRLGKNRTTVYRYENGDIENLPMSILDSLANALNTTPAYLMGWEIPNSNEEKARYVVNGPRNDFIENLHEELASKLFDREELEKIREYARFLVSLRDN